MRPEVAEVRRHREVVEDRPPVILVWCQFPWSVPSQTSETGILNVFNDSIFSSLQSVLSFHFSVKTLTIDTSFAIFKPTILKGLRT
jgi:hypothetical protein